MSSRTPSSSPAELNETLYRHGLSLAVLFDLLVAKGIVTHEEIRDKARDVNHQLLQAPGEDLLD